MKQVWKEIKYWSQLMLLPLYGLSHLIPRDKKLWVFGSTFGKRFADNPKYFYLYINQHKSNEVRAVWISKNKEIVCLLNNNRLEGYYLYSLKGIWFSLRAKVYLFDNYSKDICFPLSGGAVKINLWHGIPLKKIQKDNLFDKYRNPGNLKEKLYGIPRRISDEKPKDYVLTTSQYLAPIFASAFQTNRVFINGYPRNDCIINKEIKVILTETEQKTLDFVLQRRTNKKLVLYMPTFRDSETKFFTVMDLKRLQTYLYKENIIFLVKLHPKSKLYHKFLELEGGNIHVVNPQDDPYSLLPYIDILVTDYSSIYFDFLLTEKPIIFFPHDLEEYLEASREMYFNYNDFTPGAKVYNQDELERALLSEDTYCDVRQRLRNKVFEIERCNTGSEHLYMDISHLLHMHRKG